MYFTMHRLAMRTHALLVIYILTLSHSCRAPDWTTRVLYKCPCGDQPVAIPMDRQEETYEHGAYWCSSVLSMLSFDGSAKFVWNPFSLAQLKSKLVNFDAYLECVASKNDNSCSPPTDRIFEQQQIPLISVYQRCLSNYQETTWDQGAFVMFNKTLQAQLRLDSIMPESIEDKFNVSACLLENKAFGFDNIACMTDRFLKGTQASVYFGYSNITSTDSPPSSMIDACLTFSGPAKSANPSVSKPFKACLENSVNRSGCDIPHMMWSGRSTNKVPIATQHTLNISDPRKRKQIAMDEMAAIQDHVLKILDKLEAEWTGDQLKITIFSSEGDLLHQFADCVMQGPMGALTLTPGPTEVEKVVWSRRSTGESNRIFEIPCTGSMLANRDGVRDDLPPFTCGTYPRRAVIKHFLRKTYGGSKNNDGARQAVVKKVKELINATRLAWSLQNNFLCTCPNKTAVGWECCSEQSQCSTKPCPCPDGFEVAASVACCSSVCEGLAGSGLMATFSSIDGDKIARDLLVATSAYLRNDIWTSNDPWTLFDPQGKESYKKSWTNSQFKVVDAGLFDASKPVVYYDEIAHPFKSTFWEHCTGLMQQVIWTMPLNRKTGKPKGVNNEYDPINGQSMTPNVTYTEDFIQSLVTEAYKSSPVFWHYNVRHSPSQSEMCQRTTPRRPSAASFQIAGSTAALFGFTSMTLGGLGGADCYCGWWHSDTKCRIPDALCASLVQILGFTRICVAQNQTYNASDHRTVLASIQTLLQRQPSTVYPCPSMQISDHWGFLDPDTGQPFLNATNALLTEGVSGFRVGNAAWLFASQQQIVNPFVRAEPAETPTASVALQCSAESNPSIANHFIDELFPSAQGVRQSMPQSYCTRYGIELARLTVYQAAGLKNAASQQQGMVDKWRVRCQYKLEELAVCNSFKIYSASGGPTDTSQCPFALSVVSSLAQTYAVTPGCLLVLWNTPSNGQQDGIYDPCICVSCANTPNIDVPAQLKSICRLESFQQLVGSDVIPSETDAGVPLGSGSFRSLMDKPGFLQVNTPDISHWALHTGIRDADKILDWWPDSWKQPTGYHVTAGCSRPRDAHWKTFDASWRWDSRNEKMMFAREEVVDPLLSRNSFGASGVCRTNNYGMPLSTLNTMVVCTRENKNAKADPMVPAPAAQWPQWVDGAENCAPDAFSTPWGVDRTLNEPKQWAVGTLQQDVLAPLAAKEWGSGCGPYRLRTCRTSSDCAPGLTCILSNTESGVCSYLQPKKFECTTHAQCPDDLMCAGDGLCVQGVWQIKNSAPVDVSFRTHSQVCTTGTALDTWGTSVAEILPDVLSASGLCSYRSWFENRRMASRNQCSNLEVCGNFSGMQPWNFSAPKRQLEGQSAFDSGVLRLQAHACDRDYQFYDGFVSCTPRDSNAVTIDGRGQPTTGSFAKDRRSITYRVGKTLPIIHHTDQTTGPTYGFTGIKKTYQELGLGTGSPAIIPCSSQKLCSLQPRFMVNNQQVDQRLVVDPLARVTRGYTVIDVLNCGSFGILQDGICQLDYAVVPLAWYVLNNKHLLSSKYLAVKTALKPTYQTSETDAMLGALNALPGLVISEYIRGSPTTLQDYVAKSDLFVTLYNSLGAITNKPVYSTAGIPKQIYYLTKFGAYEVPFAWWYKCAWLAEIPMGTSPVDESICSWQSTGNVSQPTAFGNYDARLAKLLNMNEPPAESTLNTTLLNHLIKLPGIITPAILSRAFTDYAAERNSWIQRIGDMLRNVQKKCYMQKNYNFEYSDRSEEYQLARLAQMYNQVPFDTTKTYVGYNNVTVCSGPGCLTSAQYNYPTTSNQNYAETVIEAFKGCSVNKNIIALQDTQVPEINGVVAIKSLFTSTVPLSGFWNNLLTPFANIPNGCNGGTVSIASTGVPSPSCLCSSWGGCSPAVQNEMLDRANIRFQPTPFTDPKIRFKSGQESSYISIDGCSAGIDETGKCVLNDQSLNANLNLSNVREISLPAGITAETYVENRWDCVRLTCRNSVSSDDGLIVPYGYIPFDTSTREVIEIQEYSYIQHFPSSKTNPWPDKQKQDDELVCCSQRNRFAFVSGKWECQQLCSVEERFVGLATAYRMTARTLSYKVNGTLVAELEFFPCFSPREKTTDETLTQLINGVLASYNRYRSESFTMIPCGPAFTDATGMPNVTGLDMTNVRMSKSTFYPTKDAPTREEILSSIHRAISNSNKDIVTPICIERGTCTGVTERLRGSVYRSLWSFADNENKCTILKDDPYFGCMMYPGEKTERRRSGQWKNTYLCTPLMDFNHLQYTSCRDDSSESRCKDNSNGDFRDMQLIGKTFIYDIQTISPACTVGPVSQCTLVDERNKLGRPEFACAGVDSTTARYNGYVQLSRFGILKTKISQPPVVLQDNSITPNLSFDHLFLSLKRGYQCSQGQPTCPTRGALAVEMLRNLWLCMQCPLVSDIQCRGMHNCRMAAPQIKEASLNTLPGWNDLPVKQSAFLTEPDADSTIDVVNPAIAWLFEQVSSLWASDVRLSYEVPQFMQSFSGTYFFNPLMILKHDAAMQINSKTCSTASGTLPDFAACNYDSHWKNLRSFINTSYKTQDGAIIRQGETLQWRMGRRQMTSQNIPQWEAITNRTGMFLAYLFDDKRCLAGNSVDSACYIRQSATNTLVVDVLNPGLLGAFEPSVGCDTAIVDQQRVISSVCGDCANPSEYLALESDGEEMACPQSHDSVPRLTSDSTAATNLCSKTPASFEGGGSSSCKNLRGTLGSDGKAVDNLYQKLPWPGGMPAGVRSNTLFQGKPGPLNTPPSIALSPGDIGGHYVRMVLTTRSGAYSFLVQAMPLSSYTDALSIDAYSLGVSGSRLLWTQANTAGEAFTLSTTLYPNSICASWDCPLRRRAFYMGWDDKFRPSVPDPLRTQILYGTMSHPTQAASAMPTIISQTASRVLGGYSTSNGFCSCTNPPCSACPVDTPALYGYWMNSSVLASSSQCTEQLDWPYAGGTLRDGSNFKQRWSTVVPCGVLDRLPQFQYRYKNKYTTPQPVPLSARTTLDKGGVCHMGWPVVTAGPLVGCYLLVETDTFMCPSFLQPKNVTRLRAKTVDELLSSPTRPRLSDCAAPPEFMFNATASTASEVSYGQTKRWEAARLLASDLRRQLCGNSTVCRPSSQWSLPTFWATVYTANFPPVPGGNGANESLWTAPWVACVQHPNGSQTCEGTIPRKDWATGNRPQLCMDAFENSSLSKNLTQSIDVCDLDASLDLFCRTIQDARYQVFEANCFYSGQCSQQLFFYQPSIYEINNNEFVRDTVQKFYNETIEGACTPDQDTAEAIQSNAQDLEKCAAMKLNVLVNCIQIIRAIVGTLVELVYYWFELLLNVFMLIGSKADEEKDQITVQINAILSLLKNKFILLFNEIGDLLYKILFDGPMGSWLISMIKAVCSFLDWLFSDLVYVLLCWTRNACLWFLENIARGFVSVLNSISFNAFNYLNDGINNAVTAVENNINCTKKDLWSCDLSFLHNKTAVTILPMPTRCWAGVEPAVGGSLACSAADTCIQQDYTKIICGACQRASSMTKFGCNTLTKLCSCNVFPIGISSCSSHEECTIDSNDVSCRYVDSYLQPSYGNVPCTQCPNPICLITDGSGVGQCSCLLRPVPSQTCSGVGKLVSPDAGDLCLLASASSGLGSTNSYSANYRTLTSLPCMMLNQAQSYCMTVFTSATVSTQMVVGLSMLRTRRRLLWWEESGPHGNETNAAVNTELNSNNSIWQVRGEPCKSLMMATDLGILERFTRSECWRWYEIGMRLTIEANMTGVSPFFLVSWRDLVDTMLDKQALVEIMAKLPSVMHRLLLHSEFSQPVYLFVVYWSSLVPTEVWSNQTILDGMRENMFNASAQSPAGRRILQAQPEGRTLLQTNVIKSEVSSQTAYEWSQGPYSWPPNFQYWNNGDQSCAVVSTTINVVKKGLDATMLYYQTPKTEPTPVSWPALPIKRRPQPLTLTAPSDFSSIAAVSDSAKEMLSNVTDVWLDRDRVREFLNTAPYMSALKGIIQCNFTRIQTCDDRHSIFWGTVQTFVIILILGAVVKLVEIPYIDTILALMFVVILLYITYGYSPVCIPLLPTCMLSDILSLVDWLLPSTFAWPAPLVTEPECSSASCLRSCVNDPVVGYSSFYDHAAWIMCEMSPTWAVSTAWDLGTDDPVRMAVLRKCTDDSDAMRTAQRICFSITLANSTPLLFIALVAMWLTPSLLGVASAAVQFAANLLFTFVLFVHSRE